MEFWLLIESWNYMYSLIIYNFLSSLFILIYLSTNTKLIHKDRYVSGSSESMTDVATLNHVCTRKKIR